MKKKVVVILSILLFFACSKQNNEIVNKSFEEVSAKILKVSEQEVEDFYEVSGTVVSKNPVNIISKTMGTITNINVEEGKFVKKGELLIVLDSPEIKASQDRAKSAVNEAEKALEIAKTNYQYTENTYRRYENLYKEKVISRQEFENIESKRNISLEEVKRLETVLSQAKAEKERVDGLASYLKIYSPVDGIITSKPATTGMNIMPGMQLLTIETLDNLRIEVNLDEKILPYIKKGLVFPVYFSTLNKEYKGTVSEYVPAIDPVSRTFKVKIDLPKDPKISLGMFGTVKIPLGKTRKILIPKSAVLMKGQLNYVYALDEKNIATMRIIRTGKEDGNLIEVLSGLKDGDRIVEEISEKIKDGVLIRG